MPYIYKLVNGWVTGYQYVTFKADMVVTPVSSNISRWGMFIDLVLYYELFVTPTRNAMVYIPEIVYEPVRASWKLDGDVNRRPIEWRCGHCTTPNPMEERSCTQCGAPRALLIQEM